ncbi:MAG TPA: class I SAM-dependent methyltransferase [Pirellulaceae bacterium]
MVATPFDDGDLYDFFMRGFDYGIDFYTSLAKSAAGPVLDVACGTGRVLIPCLQAGLEVDGLDLFPAMLDRLRIKAEALGLRPALYQSDMNQFELPRRYGLIMICFNAIVHNLTREAQIACLECCRRHLLPGGRLAFDTFFPGPQVIYPSEQGRVLELETTDPETGEICRVYDTRTFDLVTQIQHSRMDVERINAAGQIVSSQPSETTTRWIYKAEMELLLQVTGFAGWQIYADFDRRPLTQPTDGMIVEAWTAG